MGKVLRGGAYGPDGPDDYVGSGEPPKSSWPEWFLADLEEHRQLVDASELDVRSHTSEQVALAGKSSRGRKARS